LFATRSGQPLQATHLGNALNSRRRPVPIAKFTSHDLRRTAVTNLAELGIPLQTIAAIVGHEAGWAGTSHAHSPLCAHRLSGGQKAALTTWDARLRLLVGAPALPTHAKCDLRAMAAIAAE
jgi:hypothetical protein